MIVKYILDACALTAFLYDEQGADKVQSVLEDAQSGKVEVFMHKMNILEVYYNILRSEGEEKAQLFYTQANELPITVIDSISDALFMEAGRLKASYKMSLADSIAVAEAATRRAALLTSDHHEFDLVEDKEDIIFAWIR
ncbi:MAG: type II toxin-antitoxin system VapC family toxin [Dethiobacter sp.]|jgi:PIN domain nuclease of toxin-antitoxin system|nr:type II toxin-antitoxin system VapC family toxin [Dethiobacter sp.]